MKPMHAHAALGQALQATPATPAPERWMAPRAGRLVVNAGPLWITQQGQLDDHLLQTGESLSVAAGAVLWLGPWASQQPAVGWAFKPGAGAAVAAPRPARRTLERGAQPCPAAAS